MSFTIRDLCWLLALTAVLVALVTVSMAWRAERAENEEQMRNAGQIIDVLTKDLQECYRAREKMGR